MISYCKGQTGENERAREQGIKRVRERNGGGKKKKKTEQSKGKGEGFPKILTPEGRRTIGIPPYLFAYLQPVWNNGKGEGRRRT